jgi:DNA-binding transcriptional LysR family regulator
MTKRRNLVLADLKNEEFVLLRLDSSGFAKYLHSCCLDAGFVPQVSQQVVESQAIPSLVAAGLGVALVPASLQRMHRRGVEYRALARNAPRADVYAIQRRDDASPVVRGFIAKAKETLTRLT